MKSYSFGSGTEPARYVTASLPSSASASSRARSEPRASPSGFSCVMRRKRSCVRIASAIGSRSVLVGFLGGELIDELGEPDAALHGRIVLEGQLRRSLQMKLPVDPLLEDAVRRGEAGQRPGPPARPAEGPDGPGPGAQARARPGARGGGGADA